MKCTPKQSPQLTDQSAGEWSPESWQNKAMAQKVSYPDQAHLQAVLTDVSKLPPLVTSWEIEALKGQLAEAMRGERFLLQGGDCAESFEDCQSHIIANQLKILLQMSLVLSYGSKKSVIRVGRFAGQYAKPRSVDTETRGDTTLPSYRGDLINGVDFSLASRTPNPELLRKGYECAALTLNFIRSLMEGGFADIHHSDYWDLGFVNQSPQVKEYQQIVRAIGESLGLVETLCGTMIGDIKRVDFYTSHEGLNLFYEQAQTRQVPRRVGWYNLSTHFPWIGDRTRSLEGAHVEYFRGIANPIEVKIGPSMSSEELIELIQILNPNNEAGKITLTHRFGTNQIAQGLPHLIEAVQRRELRVLWCCDPMHGNTKVAQNGYKTRNFDCILNELEQAFLIHRDIGSYLGGVHFELTGEKVTECLGGTCGLTEIDLTRAYRTQCDPRLNYEQALEMAFRIAHFMRR